MTKQKIVDVAVIGAGTAGLVARRRAENEGASTVIMDPGPLGTKCARVGCMPSKLLIAAAEAAYHARNAGAFGLKTSVDVNGEKIMGRVRKERDRFVESTLGTFRELDEKGLLIHERGSFMGPHTLQAGQTMIEAKSIVVATGSRSVIPEPYQPYSNFILTHENIFEMKKLPESVLVVGAGIIGLELGQALDRLGVRVTLLGLDRLTGPLTDPEVREDAVRIFSSEIDFSPHHHLIRLELRDGQIAVSFDDEEGKTRQEVFEKVLVATGQKPNLGNLGLEKADVHLGEKGMPQVDPETTQVEKSHIFLAGDADPFRPVLHEAAFEGRVAGRNAARFPNVRRTRRKCQLAIVFTDPQMAVVGKSWNELKSRNVCCGEVDYGKQGRSQVMNVNRGKVRLYGDKESKRLLGAEMLGPRVEHTAHLLAWVIEKEMPVDEILQMPFYHPVFEEGIQTALEDLSAQLEGRKACSCTCDEWGPGT